MMYLNDRLKEAFDKIRADDEIKKHTKEFILQKTYGYGKSMCFPYKRLAVVIACLLTVLLGWGGYSAYFTSIAAISVDINPSVELGINRFDKVVSVEIYNEDGYTLMSSMDIRFMDYRDALEQILASESMVQYLTQDQYVVVTVFGTSEEKNFEMLTNLTVCTASFENVHCSSGNSEEVAAAHSAGMSFGKYKAFLKLQTLNPDITTEDVKGLTMRQIRDMINALSSGIESTIQKGNTNKGRHFNYGNGNGYGNRRRNGQGAVE